MIEAPLNVVQEQLNGVIWQSVLLFLGMVVLLVGVLITGVPEGN